MASPSFSLTRPASPAVQDTLRSVLRIVAAFLYLCHGAQKLFGVLAGAAPGGGHPVPLWSLYGLAGVIELVGGTLICIGLFTQIAAFIASGEMAVAYFLVHWPRGFMPIVNRGELPVLFCFLFLSFAFAGAGRISVDALLQKRRASV